MQIHSLAIACEDGDGFKCLNSKTHHTHTHIHTHNTLNGSQELHDYCFHTLPPTRSSWFLERFVQLFFSYSSVISVSCTLLASYGFCIFEEGLNSEIYDIDYRGPETHSHRPPPNITGNGVPHNNLKKHPQSKRHTTGNAKKKVRSL